ncbi:envoplakin-like [Sphaeramia orbicularis]|uniref:envoplakin-like n=1 Tax=Sphaeramia orbicularis TaxID=375764 RepID=UPI00117C64DC|nr:envoplakin-like [Sphaeramia orbicularis]
MASRMSNSTDLSNKFKMTNTRNSTLAKLVTKIQKNADHVEADMTRRVELMNVVAEIDNPQILLQHRDEVKDKLDGAEGLLKDLFLDVDKVKELQHEETEMIEKGIHILHHHWMVHFDCHRRIYPEINNVSRPPIIDWARVFNWKQKQLNMAGYGPTLADLEKQIEAHNVLQKEIEFSNSWLCIETAGSEVFRESAFSHRLIPPQSRTGHSRRSFLLAAIKLFNIAVR